MLQQQQYRRAWLLVVLCVVSAFSWTVEGRAWFLKRFHPPEAIAESARSASGFVALAFPTITRDPGRFTLPQEDFEGLLMGLKAMDYTSIGFDDVREFYLRKRLLPPRSVLVTLERDSPENIRLADIVLRRLRWKGGVFLTPPKPYETRRLSPHAIEQLRKAGAWNTGEVLNPDSAAAREFAFGEEDARFRFVASRTGYNDSGRDVRALRIFPVRPGVPIPELALMIQNQQPRRADFIDRFQSPALSPPWVAEAGVVSGSERRLALLPQPRQTSATVFLSGTDGWRDLVLEFELQRVKKAFWAYCRWSGTGSYLRTGVSKGVWSLQQKKEGAARPATLGRSQPSGDEPPYRARLVLKDDWAFLYINGRMPFGKALQLDPSVKRGRVQLGVYDKEPKSAMAVVTFVRALPLGVKWTAVKDYDGPAELDPLLLDMLRSEAVESRALSPEWVSVSPEKGAAVSAKHKELLRALASFYHCRLVPMVRFSSSDASLFQKPAAAERLASSLAAAAKELEGSGLNLRLAGGDSAGGETARFLKTLRAKLQLQRQELWITRTSANVNPSWEAETDGILSAVAEPAPGLELLEAVR